MEPKKNVNSVQQEQAHEWKELPRKHNVIVSDTFNSWYSSPQWFDNQTSFWMTFLRGDDDILVDKVLRPLWWLASTSTTNRISLRNKKTVVVCGDEYHENVAIEIFFRAISLQ